MASSKIIEFRREGLSFFTKYLEFLSQQKGWGWQFEVHPQYAPELMKGALAVKVDLPLSDEILPQLAVLPTLVRSLQCLDSFFYEDNKWFPRLLLHEALREVLVHEANDLDTRAPAFIVGENEEARISSAVAAEIGVSEIFLVGKKESLRTQYEILSRSQIGIHFHTLSPEDLTLQVFSAGIAINAVDLSEKKNLLTDLSYFNYMKGSGYVLDLNMLPVHNLLLEEAQRAELRVLPPLLVAVTLTRMWLRRLKVSPDLSSKEIEESWKLFLKQNSSSV
ncbi:MAG: hypothetical protein AAGB31_08995 [Bdellovibrio sp.]